MVQLALCDDEMEELNAMERMCFSYCGECEEYGFLPRRFESADRLREIYFNYYCGKEMT